MRRNRARSASVTYFGAPMATKRKPMAKPRQKESPCHEGDPSKKSRKVRKIGQSEKGNEEGAAAASIAKESQSDGEGRGQSELTRTTATWARRPIRPTIGPDSGRPWCPNPRPARSRINSTSPFRYERMASMKAAYIDRGAPKSYKPEVAYNTAICRTRVRRRSRRRRGSECQRRQLAGARRAVRAGDLSAGAGPRSHACSPPPARARGARAPPGTRSRWRSTAAGVVHRRCAAPPGRRSFQASQRFLARGRSSGNVLATAQRLLCFVQRPPQPRNLHRRKLPQRFPYPQAYGSETAATPPNGHVRQERATEAYRPEAPLRQSALLRVPLSRRQQRAEEADFRPEAPLQHSALPRVIWQSRPSVSQRGRCRRGLSKSAGQIPNQLGGREPIVRRTDLGPEGISTAPRSAPSCQ